MTYFILFNILPIETVYYIFMINKKEKSKIIISNFIKNINYKNFAFIRLLESYILLKTSYNIKFFYKTNYKFMRFLNNYSTRKSRFFWIHYLNIIQNKLYSINKYLLFNSFDNIKIYNYVLYKKLYKYWFKICIKYNIKIEITIYNNFYDGPLNRINYKVTSRYFDKIKSNFKIYNIPYILDDNFNKINEFDSFQYLYYNY